MTQPAQGHDAARRLRVTLDVSAVHFRPTGPGRYALDLGGALALRSDVALTFLCRSDDADRWRKAAPEADVVAAVPRRRLHRLAWEQLALPRLLRRLDVDVHHAPHYTMPEAAALPRVVTVHDVGFIDHPEWHERPKAAFFGRAIRVAARHAEAVVCVSKATADRLSKLCPPAARLVVIPNGVDLERFSPTGDQDHATLATLGVRRPYVLFVGTLEPSKDVPTLVHAFDRVAAEHPDLSLVLAGGDARGAKAVNAAVAAAHHGSRILRTGYVPDDAVPPLLRQAAAVAYPSLEDGFGLSALEALACGAPLVTTTGSAMEEVAAGAALLVEPRDSDGLAGVLDMLVRGDAGADDRRRRGLAVAARHTWTASAAAHVEVYRAVADPSPSGSLRP